MSVSGSFQAAAGSTQEVGFGEEGTGVKRLVEHQMASGGPNQSSVTWWGVQICASGVADGSMVYGVRRVYRGWLGGADCADEAGMRKLLEIVFDCHCYCSLDSFGLRP